VFLPTSKQSDPSFAVRNSSATRIASLSLHFCLLNVQRNHNEMSVALPSPPAVPRQLPLSDTVAEDTTSLLQLIFAAARMGELLGPRYRLNKGSNRRLALVATQPRWLLLDVAKGASLFFRRQ
jgi:hypothetical protein